MKQPLHILSALVLLTGLALPGCDPVEKTDLASATVIPLPASITSGGQRFTIDANTRIELGEGDLAGVANMLADMFTAPAGFTPAISEGEGGSGVIHLMIDESMPAEGYSLEIESDHIHLHGGSAAGVFYGVQTLRQLLPDAIESSSGQEASWSVPTGTITDAPTHAHRGAMLDVSRHFFGLEDVKRYIDFIAAYKMNVFHMHLTDDQGWRIEIKSWPNLTEHGGSTEVGGGKGGFFTQEEYAEIVGYAADRFITVIPEIDMPGHTNAALSSYAELNCDNKAPDLYTGIEVGFSSLCTDKDLTYEFLDDVIGEVAAMTPGPYIHIGGDESHSTELEDYLPFINRVKEIVESHGKQMIGWDEVAQAEIGEGSVVQLWHNADFAKMAVAKGAQLIMSPANKAYLDMQYDSTSRIGLHWAAYIEVDEGYTWDPATVIEGLDTDAILGIEAPLWTETVENMEDIEYLVFPRLPGYAEIGWTAPEQRSWDTYQTRLANHASRMSAREIDYYPSSVVPWESE